MPFSIFSIAMTTLELVLFGLSRITSTMKETVPARVPTKAAPSESATQSCAIILSMSAVLACEKSLYLLGIMLLRMCLIW